MKTIGLITEYNPFHNGHLYHLEKSKKDLAADFCIVLMSGSFVQRGAPAIYDKYVRAAMALYGGADLVLEMPAAFSTASAREFAAYGISLFTALGAVDAVSFGSECGELSSLMNIAALLLHETEEYSTLLKESVKRGMTYPEARNEALLRFLKPEDRNSLNAPNNILGIEYCRAAMELRSPLMLHTISRMGRGYHDTSADSRLSSATAIRQSIEAATKKDKGWEAMHSVPAFVQEIIGRETPLFTNDFSSLLNYRILAQQDLPPLEEIADMTPELASRIRKNALTADTFENRISQLKSRQITYTRVSRALLHLLLNMKTSDVLQFKQAGYAPYARILGFKKSAAPLLSSLKASSSIPLISKLADASGYLPAAGINMLNQEIQASHLYSFLKKEKGCVFKNEYTQPVIII